MNRLSLARRTNVINCLVEGNSIRSTERMTGTHRDTIMRLLVQVGEGCASLMDSEMHDLPCRRRARSPLGAENVPRQLAQIFGFELQRLAFAYLFSCPWNSSSPMRR